MSRVWLVARDISRALRSSTYGDDTAFSPRLSVHRQYTPLTDTASTLLLSIKSLSIPP